MWCQWWAPSFWQKVWLNFELCDWVMLPNMAFLRESGNWVKSYGFWVWVMKTEYWVMKTETPLNQTGPNSLAEIF